MADYLKELPPGSESVEPNEFNRVVYTLNGKSGSSVGANFFASNPPLGNAVTLVAAPTGVDDTTVLQAAIDGRNTAANNAVPTPGGIVQLQAGTYIADNLIIPSGVTLQGAGIEATVLQLKNGVAVSHALLSTKNFDTLTGTNPGSGDQGPYNFGLRDLTLDGNKANNGSNTAIAALRTYGYGFHVENVRIRKSKTAGWYSEWSSNANDPTLGDSMEAHVLNVKVHDNDGDGVIWNGPHDSNWGNAESYHNLAAGFWVKVNGNNTKFENVHAWHASQTYGFNCDATAYFTGCLAEGASVAQVKFQANDCSWIAGNVFATGAGFVGIQLGPTGLIAGTHINTKISGCNSGAIQFTNEQYSVISADVYQTAGTPTTGTPDTTSLVLVAVNGMATAAQGVFQIPSGVAVMKIGSTPVGAGSGSGLSVSGRVASNVANVAAVWDAAVSGGTHQWKTNNTTTLMTLSAAGVLGLLNAIQPGTPAGATQTGQIFMGSGVPNNANGNNGDIYFRSDGGAGTTIYQRRAGVWVATAA